jgi:hypothetical protein
MSRRKRRFRWKKALYRQRNLVERFFNKLKQFRRIATRYDKLGDTFLAFIHLAVVRISLRSIESTPYSREAFRYCVRYIAGGEGGHS